MMTAVPMDVAGTDETERETNVRTMKGKVAVITSEDPRIELESIVVIHDTLRSQVSKALLDGNAVVIKRTKIRGTTCLGRFQREKSALIKCAHPNVISPLYIVEQAPLYGFVLPLATRGSLHDALHNLGADFRETRLVLRDEWIVRASIASDTARALAYMHSIGLSHRDVKPANVLLDQHFCAKITDFECIHDAHAPKRAAQEYSGPSGGFFKDSFVGTLIYMAPEIFLKSLSASYVSADVYAFGVLLNELATGCIPYSDVRTTAEQLHTVVEANYSRQDLMKAVCTQELRPNTPLDSPNKAQDEWMRPCPEAWSTLASQCWDQVPERRPSTADISCRLDSMFDSSHARAAAERAIASLQKQSRVDGESAVAVDLENMAEVSKLRLDVGGAPTTLAANLRSGGYAQQGKRHSMEDAFCVRVLRGTDGAIPFGHILCVFDGHGGSGMAKFSEAWLAPELEARLASRAESAARSVLGGSASSEDIAAVEQCLQDAFLGADAAWKARNEHLIKIGKIAEIDPSGCTALVALVLGEHLWVASAGDCRSLLFKRDGSVSIMNVEHHPDLPEERARIEAAGASLKRSADGLLRVNGHLRVSRALGDLAFKSLGVTAKPQVTRFKLDGTEKYFMMATDGLFDVLQNERVGELLDTTVKHVDFGAKRVVMEALALGSIDNVTAIVCYIGDD